MQRITPRRSAHLVLFPLLALQCALPKLSAIEGDGDGDVTTDTNNSGGLAGDGDGDGDGSGGDSDSTGDGDGDGDGSGGDNEGSGGDDGTGDGDGDSEGSGGDSDGSGGDSDGSGGDSSGSGGDSSGSGGNNDGAGGDANAAYCPGMSGGFAINDGYASNSVLCGPVVPVTGGYGEVMAPANFVGDDLCTHGSLPPNAGGVYPFLAFVMESQTYPNGTVNTWGASGRIGVSWTAGGLTSQVRINLVGANGTRYCLLNPVSGTTYYVSDFTEECWITGGIAFPAGAAVTAIELVAPATNASQNFDGFCLTNIINE